MLRDFFGGSINIHMLHDAAQEPIDGLAMMGVLAWQGCAGSGVKPSSHSASRIVS